MERVFLFESLEKLDQHLKEMGYDPIKDMKEPAEEDTYREVSEISDVENKPKRKRIKVNMASTSNKEPQYILKEDQTSSIDLSKSIDPSTNQGQCPSNESS
jgi:predicted transport protein